MFVKTARALTPCLAAVAACCLILSPAPPAQAGGFGLRVELPSPAFAATAEGRDTLLVIYAVGCRGPGAALSAKAEGLVDGRRVSLPLRLSYRGSDMYTLTRQWPTEGTWLVSLSAKAQPIVTPKLTFRPFTSVLVEFAPGGGPREVTALTDRRSGETRQIIRTRTLRGQDKAKEITAVLQASATPNNRQDVKKQTATMARRLL